MLEVSVLYSFLNFPVYLDHVLVCRLMCISVSILLPLLNRLRLYLPFCSARADVLDYLVKDMPESERADALLNTNEEGLSLF